MNQEKHLNDSMTGIRITPMEDPYKSIKTQPLFFSILSFFSESEDL